MEYLKFESKVWKWFISFVFAVVTWVSFSFYLGQPIPFEYNFYHLDRELVKNVPIYVQLRSDMLHSYNISITPESTDLLLKGRRKFLNYLDDRNVGIYLSLRDIEEGEYEVVPEIKIPNGVSLALKSDLSFTVKVDSIDQTDSVEIRTQESLSEMLERVV